MIALDLERRFLVFEILRMTSASEPSALEL